MTGVWVVAKREIVEKRLALLVAGVAGVIVLLFTESLKSDETRAVLVLCGMAGLGGGAALLFGASTLGRELKEKRLSFFFSQPLAPGTIWGGKLAATLLLSLAMAVLCALPATLVFGVRGEHVLLTLGFIALILVFLVAISDVTSSALRSRSPWAFIDFVFLAAVIVAVVWSVRKLFVEGWWGFGTPSPALVALAVGVPLLILLAASYARVAVGRTDIRRAHGVQSVVLWGLALPLTAAFVGFTLWLSSPTPGDLTSETIGRAAPAGGWEFVVGRVRHRGDLVAAFLRKKETGHFVRFSRWASYSNTIAFSADGRRAAWIERIGSSPPFEVVAAELGSGAPRIVRTGLTPSNGVLPLALSPDGQRLAVLQDGVLSIYEIPNPSLPKALATVRLPDLPCISFSFAESQVVISLAPQTPHHQKSRERRFSFDITSKKLSEVPPEGP